MAVIHIEQHTVSSEGVTLDSIIWQRFHEPKDGLLEYMLEMPENYLLEHQETELAVGTVVHLPIFDDEDRYEEKPIDLFSVLSQ